MQRQVVMFAFALTMAMSGAAFGSAWQIDTAHTSAEFAVRHLMLSTVRGTFSNITGTAKLDERDITKSRVEATIDVSTINTREVRRDSHLRDTDFFDVKRYPSMTFTSKGVTKVDDQHYKITGDLTIRGVTKEIVLDVEGAPTPLKDPVGTLKLGGVVHTKINRQDFGMTWNKTLDSGGVVVGDDVDVTVDVELSKER